MTTFRNRVIQILLSAPIFLSLPAAGAESISSSADLIADGKALLTQTHQRLPDNVGNGLNCTSCHLEAGTKSKAAPWIGITSDYPGYSARNGRIISLENRINDCFLRSMNGKALNDNSAEMRSILAYMAWLSKDVSRSKRDAGRGFVNIDRRLVPDPHKGATIYAARCAACHGANGLGGVNAGIADGAGVIQIVVPPLWGANSFNIGAGMARSYTAAAFVKHNMPLGKGETLSDQEAVDVAAYFTQQSRPGFAGQSKDWPSGGRPTDARN